MDEMSLDRMLSRASAHVAYPPTPPLRPPVLRAIASPPAGAARPAWGYALAAAVIAGMGMLAALAVTPSRHAIADFFGIEGSRIERLPTAAPGVTPTPFPTPSDIETIATPVPLAEVPALSGFTPALPQGEPPSGVYVVPLFDRAAVVLVYAQYDLWQAQLDEGFASKWLSATSVLEDTTVNGLPARWISGGAHIVRFVGPDGRDVVALQRTVTRNTLVWRTEAAFYRLETDLELGDALAIASALP